MTVPHDKSAALAGLPHGFFGRAGGVSTGDIEGLNCGVGSQDDPKAVAQNRALVRNALGADHLLTAYQTHSATALYVDAPFEERPKADALVTDRPGLAIGVLAADCVPVLLHAPDKGLVAAIHAGWKGSLGGIIAATARVLEELGADLSRTVGAIGPCLRAPAFEVGQDLVDAVLAAHPNAEQHFAPREEPGKFTYDHTAFCLDRLEEAGISPASITVEGGCTLTHPDTWYSYRASRQAGLADYGRNISVIATSVS